MRCCGWSSSASTCGAADETSVAFRCAEADHIAVAYLNLLLSWETSDVIENGRPQGHDDRRTGATGGGCSGEPKGGYRARATQYAVRAQRRGGSRLSDRFSPERIEANRCHP